MKNLSIEQVIIAASIITMIVTYFILKYKEGSKKWYDHILAAFFLGVFVSFYSLLLIKLDTNELLNNSITVFFLSYIIIYSSKNKRKWYYNIIISLNFAILTFGVQQFLKNNLSSSNKEILSVSQSDIDKQKMMDSYTIFEQISIKDDDKLGAQEKINNNALIYFEDYMKFKENVCSSKLDSTEKQMRLISFNSSNIKNVLVYVDGIEELSYLISHVSNDLSLVENKKPDESIEISDKRHDIIRKYHRKIEDFVYNFEDCSSKTDLKSKNLYIEIEKIDKPLDEVRSSVMKIMMKNL